MPNSLTQPRNYSAPSLSAKMPTATELSTINMVNAGPLTTTFTAAESCSTVAFQTALGVIEENRALIYWALECEGNSKSYANIDGCLPSAKEIAETFSSFSEQPTPTYGALVYHSPGFDCPKGWTTAAVAAKDASGSLSTSGVIYEEDVWATTTEAPLSPPVQRVFAQALDNNETAVICCPR